ncbi:MAG: hypothetical protein QGF67_09740 [Lentisphaeria bacterium]|nr:hypothetical protein [Lentisphaeria bacterium]
MRDNAIPIDADAGNPAAILSLVDRTRSLLRSSWVVTGVGITVGVLFSAVLAVTVSDFVMAWSPAFRLICLLLVVVPTVWVFVIGAVSPLLRNLSSAIVARRIEREMPGIHNRIVSCVDLATGNAAAQSPAFHRRLITEALGRIRNFQPRDTLDRPCLKRSAIFAVAAILVFAVAFLIAPGRLPNALARIVKPFADIPPVTSVSYHVLVGGQESPGDYDTLRGSDLDFNVIVTKGEVDRPGGNDPLRLEIFTVDEKGEEKKLSFSFPAVEGDSTSYRLTGLQHTLSYRVYGGGTWSKQYRVNMLDRPEIVGLQTVVRYPPYIPAAPVVGAPNVPHVTGPRRSIAEVVVDVEGDAVEGQIQMLQLRRRGTERLWFNDSPPDGALRLERDSIWQWDETMTNRRLHGATPAEGPHGHGFDNAKSGFEVHRGDTLFAAVFLVPWRLPETIMIEWYDGESWEHRAYWGADSIPRGQPDTASRRFMGALPSPAELTRLEVAAELVGLEDKRLTGVRFTVLGGLARPSVIGMPVADLVARHAGQRIEFYDTAGTALEALPENQHGSVSVYIPSDTGQDNYQFNEAGVVRQHLRSYGKDYKPGVWTFVETAADHPPPEGTEIPPEPPAGCLWGATGSLPADPELDRELVATGSFPLVPLSGNDERSQWRGTFPLLRNGYYRLELRNRLNHSNQRTQEGKITTLLDNPPQISVDQPGIDLVVSAPVDVAIHFSAYDDFGVDKIILQLQKDENAPFDSRVVKTYDTTQRSASGAVILNLVGENAAIGDTLRFRLEVRDRKAQSAVSPVHVIRIVADEAEAADQVFAVYEKETDTFHDKLETLLDEQQTIHETVVELADKEKAEPPGNAEVQEPELRQKLTELANREDRNVELGKTLAEELKKLTEQTPEIDFLPPEIARQQEIVQQAFGEMAVDPMAELSALLREPEAKIEDIERQSEQVRENLDAVMDRMETLAKAQTDSRDDLEDALAELREDLMSQDADAAARELEDLKEFMDELAHDLEILKGVQEELIADNEKDLSDRLRDSLAEDQAELEKEIEEKIEDVQELLDPLRDEPLFPDRPYNPEQEEYLVPPAENDTPATTDAARDKKDQDEPEDDEELEPEIFLPALGGPTPKLDPRFEDDVRDVLEKAQDSDPEKNKMRSRQFEKVQELDMAQKAVESDQQSVAEMIDALGEEADSPEAMQQLADVLNSENLEQAKGMLQRLPQGDNRRPPKPGAMGDPLAQLPEPIEGERMADILTGLVSLDLKARTVIMKMQPRQREQMLQGLREEGPEGYRSFIRDYFQRLTRVQAGQ